MDLSSALKDGDIPLVEQLINENPEKNGIQLEQLLRERGVEANNKTLLLACENGYTSLVQLLIKYGVDIHTRDDEAFKIACRFEYDDIAKILIANGVEYSQYDLLTACEWGLVFVVKLLIELNHRDGIKCEHALDVATWSENVSIVKLLLENGAKISDCTLSNACQLGNVPIVKLLLEHGAEVNDEALLIASSEGFVEVCKLLLAHRVNVNTEVMARAPTVEIVKLLLEHGGNIQNDSLFHRAMKERDTELVKCLLEYGMKIQNNREDVYTDCLIPAILVIESDEVKKQREYAITEFTNFIEDYKRRENFQVYDLHAVSGITEIMFWNIIGVKLGNRYSMYHLEDGTWIADE